MLRPNMIGLWIGMCAVIIIHTLIIRKHRFILKYFLFFISGIVVLTLPFFIWLAARGSLSDFYRCYFQFNFGYINVPITDVIRSIYNACKYSIVTIVIAILLILLFNKANRKSDKYIFAISIVSMFGMTVLLTSLSGNSFLHYYMVYLPCLVLPVAWMWQEVCSRIKINPILVLVIISVILYQSLFYGVIRLRDTMHTDNTGSVLASFIKENTIPEEPILYIGNYCQIYFLSDRSPAGYYPYYTMMTMNYSSIIESYINELESKKPRLIAYGNRELPEAIYNYINNNYTITNEYNGHIICLLK